MKCPHCNKEIDRNLLNKKKEEVLKEICKEVHKEVHSISSLSRKLQIKRSTMRYYLGLLKEENLMFFERQQNKPGRPTYIKPKTI